MKEAVKGYETAIELQPTDSSSHFNLGVLYQDSQERYKKAVKCFETVTKLTPDDAAAWRRLGDLYLNHLDDEEKALVAFSKHNEITQENSDVWRNVGYLEAAVTFDNDKARAAYERAIALNDQDEMAHCWLADLLARCFDDVEQAELHYECAIAILPDYLYAIGNLLELKLDNDAPEAEIQPFFDSVLELDEYNSTWHMRYCRWVGITLERTHEGRELYLAALKKFPDFEGLIFQFILFTGVYSCCYHDITPYIEFLESEAEDDALLSGFVGTYYSYVEGDEERAEIWIKRMLELGGEEHYELHTAGEYYLFRALDFETARDLIARAKADSNSCSPLPAHQALMAYFIDDDKAAAKEFLAEAVQIDLEEDGDDLPCDEALIIAYAEGDLETVAEGAARLIEDDPSCYENHLMLMLAIEQYPAREDECKALLKEAKKMNIAKCDIEATIAWIKAPLKTRKPY